MKYLVTLVVCMVLLHLTSGQRLRSRREKNKYDAGHLRLKRQLSGSLVKQYLAHLAQQMKEKAKEKGIVWPTAIATTPTTTTPTTATIVLPTTPTTATIALPTNEQRCILLIGGDNEPEVDLVEYYHPTKAEGCDVAAIGNMSRVDVTKVERSSACFLSDTEQILIREGLFDGANPPMLYGLSNPSATQLPRPHKQGGKDVTVRDTVMTAVSGCSCISCGGRFRTSPYTSSPYTYSRACYQFDSELRKWTTMAEMPHVAAVSASVLMGGNDFYVIGGSDYPRQGKDLLFRYNVSAKTWHTEPSMNEKRFFHAAAPLSDTEFIVCGGYDKEKSCEIYDTMKKTWRCGGYMKVGRHSFQMINFNGQVYALAGVGAGQLWGKTTLVEKYDEATNTWSVAKPLKQERHKFVAVVV